jgi:hypothetical protein
VQEKSENKRFVCFHFTLFISASRVLASANRGLNISRELKIVYRKDKHLGRAAKIFVEMARKE